MSTRHTVLPREARSGSGAGAPVELHTLMPGSQVHFEVNVSKRVSNHHCKLDVILETSPDGKSGWQKVAQFRQIEGGTGETSASHRCSLLRDHYRIAWQIAGGQPKDEFTFGVEVKAV